MNIWENFKTICMIVSEVHTNNDVNITSQYVDQQTIVFCVHPHQTIWSVHSGWNMGSNQDL